MTLKPYPNYKDSGVEWLGQVPEHWEVMSIKHISKIEGGSTPKSEQPEYWDGDIVWVTPSDLSKLTSIYLSDSQRKITLDGLRSCGANLVPKGSIILSTRAPIGSLAIASTELCTNQGCKSVILNQNHDYRYFGSLFEISSKELNSRGKGTTFLELSSDELGLYKVTVPPIQEQTTIATYLDRETARLDELIAHKTRFIELLKEKRSALITHAVTKGLDPNVRMKDSGVEWLGQVPKHWEVMAIKHIVETPITDGPHETPEFVDDGVPFVSAEAVSSGYIDFNKIRGYISEEDDERYSKKYRPRRNDIFMIKSGATTGITAIVDTDIKFNIWSPLAVIRCGKRSNPKFVLNFMRSKSYQEAIKLNWSFGTQQNIGMGVIGDIAIPVPPIQEQTAIAAYLDRETGRLDELLQLTEQSISLIKERRSALITSAVTGKIDVREQNSIGITS